MSEPVLVVDASAIVEVLRRSELGERVARALRGAVLAAPAHMDAEVLSAIGRLARGGRVEDAAVETSLQHLRTLPVQRYSTRPFLLRAWALRHTIALRDGLYVACAEALGASLLTVDARLGGSGAPVPVHCVR